MKYLGWRKYAEKDKRGQNMTKTREKITQPQENYREIAKKSGKEHNFKPVEHPSGRIT
jgi:hypothetical protein